MYPLVPTLGISWQDPLGPLSLLLHEVSPPDIKVSPKASGCEVPAATVPPENPLLKRHVLPFCAKCPFRRT